MGENLISGIKDNLVFEFRRLYLLHGKGWRKKLKAHNAWHQTEKGINAWRNISNRGTGNETLRLIIADMKSIIAAEQKKPIAKRLGFSKPKP